MHVARAGGKMATHNLQTLRLLSLFLKLFGAMPLLIGLGLLTGACFSLNRQYTILKSWPTVDAEVASSELTHRRQTTAESRHPTTVYQAHIDFRYSVGGKQYTSPAGRDYSSSSYAEMKQKVDTYAPGTHHPIRYNPANPNDIRYDAGFSFEFFLAPFILAITGIMFTFGGVAMFVVARVVGRANVGCPSCGAMVRRTDPRCPNCGTGLLQGSG